ncbi:hypothetical protein BV898_01928 [Hypsibius exemplaris]|uniref:Nuclear pore complex protein Nup98-Nup96 n=1 Tax=Hypsibius exemplaris TaxID=2072580 RepID=A0A1W0XA74_HYPEX|nr:hypothetical protein BV898_01928 [Hypsibius exemplaris]
MDPLSRSGYFVEPALPESEAHKIADLFVKDLTVGRRGFGRIFFPGRTAAGDLKKVSDLQSIINFERHSVELYPSCENTPIFSHGLNRSAIVIFEDVDPFQAWKLIRSHRNIRTHCQYLHLKDVSYTLVAEHGSTDHGTDLSAIAAANSPNSSFVTRQAVFENAGRQAFYTRDLSRIMINNGPVRRNPFLDEFRERRNQEDIEQQLEAPVAVGGQAEVSGSGSNLHQSFAARRPLYRPISKAGAVDQLHADRRQPSSKSNSDTDNSFAAQPSLYPRIKQNPTSGRSSQEAIDMLDNLPPLEGDAEDLARYAEEMDNAQDEAGDGDATRYQDVDFPSTTFVGASGGAASKCPVSSVGSFLSVENCHIKPFGIPETQLTDEENNNVVEAVHEMSDASLALFDQFRVAYLEICTIAVNEGCQVLITPGDTIPDLLDILANRLWQSTNPYVLRDVRYALTLIDALHRSVEAPGFARVDRPEAGRAFVKWVVNILPELRRVQTPHANGADLSQSDWDDIHAQVFDLLTLGKLHEAAEFAMDQNATDLGELITSIANPPVSPEMDAKLHAVLTANLNTGTDIVTKILLLLTGMICDRFISACDGLDWLSCLGLYAVFAVNSDSDPTVSAIIDIYEDAEATDSGWIGPTSSNSRQVPLSRPPVLLYDIANLFLGRIDLEPLLQKLDPYKFDVSFQWLLLVTLKSMGYFVRESLFESTTQALAISLKSGRNWESAVAVLLHGQPSAQRDEMIKGVVVSGISNLEMGCSTAAVEDFVVRKLSLPREWVLEGKAARALRHYGYWEAAKLLIELKQFHKAGKLVLEKLLPDIEQSGSSDAYRDLFVLGDALAGASELPEMEFYRPFLPLLMMLKTYGRLQEGDNMAEVLLEQLEKDLTAVKTTVMTEMTVTPVMRNLTEMVDNFLKDRRTRLAHANQAPGRSFLGQVFKLFGK